MSVVIDHPMSKEELEALIKNIAAEIHKTKGTIEERWGSITKARAAKKRGDLQAGNFLRERNKLLSEKRDWQKGLDALLPKKSS